MLPELHVYLVAYRNLGYSIIDVYNGILDKRKYANRRQT